MRIGRNRSDILLSYHTGKKKAKEIEEMRSKYDILTELRYADTVILWLTIRIFHKGQLGFINLEVVVVPQCDDTAYEPAGRITHGKGNNRVADKI